MVQSTAVRQYPVRCVFCQDEGVVWIEDAQDVERQEVARYLVQLAAHYSTADNKITAVDLIGPRRTLPIVDVRHEAMWFLHDEMGLTYQQVGRYLNRDHSSCVHGVQKHRKRIEDGLYPG